MGGTIGGSSPPPNGSSPTNGMPITSTNALLPFPAINTSSSIPAVFNQPAIATPANANGAPLLANTGATLSVVLPGPVVFPLS